MSTEKKRTNVLDLSKKLEEKRRKDHEKRTREIIERAHKRLDMFKETNRETEQDDDPPDSAA